MKKQRLIAALAAVAIVGTIGVSTAFASSNTRMKMDFSSLTTEQQAEIKERGPKMTIENREEMEAKFQEKQDKWNSLTDAQKAEMYALQENCDAAQNAMIDKQVEFGLIDSETAQQMKQSHAEMTADMKANGRMIMSGRKIMHHKAKTDNAQQ